MMRTLIMLAIIAAATASSILSDQMKAVLDDDARICTIGTNCNEDSDCQCANPDVICNYKQKCKEISFWDKIVRKKPCFRKFKSNCTVNSDCECGLELICEDRECVVNRQRTMIVRRY